MFILAELRNLVKLHPRGFDKNFEQQIQVDNLILVAKLLYKY